MKTLLMGGQACVLYGAAEFSKDSDFVVLISAENLKALQNALGELQAKNIAVPPFETEFLERGHAVHFRCFHPDCEQMRVDVMAKMRGVDSFAQLWERRTTFELENGENAQVLAINDLVRAKKTQRNKDWPMIQRLVEAHYFTYRADATPQAIGFWLQELRTPSLLREAARIFEAPTQRNAAILARRGASEEEIEVALYDEEKAERALDRAYWQPLKAELESLRRNRPIA